MKKTEIPFRLFRRASNPRLQEVSSAHLPKNFTFFPFRSKSNSFFFFCFSHFHSQIIQLALDHEDYFDGGLVVSLAGVKL